MWNLKIQAIPMAVFILLLLNLIVGMSFLNDGLFHADSIGLARAVEKTYEIGQLQTSSKARFGAVIVNSILYYPFYVSGQNADFVTRFSSIFFHALSIIVLFLLIAGWFKSNFQAFTASLLLSFTPFYFSPNTYGKEHGMSIFFLLCSFFLLQKGAQKGSWRLIAASSFLYAFSVSIRESLLAVLPIYLILYFSPFQAEVFKERCRVKSILALLVPLVVMAGAILATGIFPEYYKTWFVKDPNNNNFDGLFSPHLWHAMRDLARTIPFPVFILAVFGVFKMFQKENSFIVILLTSWAMLIFYYGNTSCYTARYLDVPIIPFYIFTAYGLDFIGRKYKLAARAILVYCVTSMVIFMYPMINFRHHYNGPKQFALYVKAVTERDAVILASEDSPYIEYYGRRKTLYLQIQDNRLAKEQLDLINDHLRNGVPVYIAEHSYVKEYELFRKRVLERDFYVDHVGQKLGEDTRRPEIVFRFYHQNLYKLRLKG